jgi:hypothetical protein
MDRFICGIERKFSQCPASPEHTFKFRREICQLATQYGHGTCCSSEMLCALSFRPCFLLRYFYPQKMWGFGVYPILSNPLKYSFLKILYHDKEFLI